MKKEHLCALSLLLAILMCHEQANGKKVIIHVPYKVKSIKHTHTIYKIIPHQHQEKQDHDRDKQGSEEFDHYRK